MKILKILKNFENFENFLKIAKMAKIGHFGTFWKKRKIRKKSKIFEKVSCSQYFQYKLLKKLKFSTNVGLTWFLQNYRISKFCKKLKISKIFQKLQKWPKSAILALFEKIEKNRKKSKIFQNEIFSKFFLKMSAWAIKKMVLIELVFNLFTVFSAM